jgi:hypothetical protein
MVDPYEVPVYLLRVPVRYYRHAPAYFRGWRADAPPRWQEHWGRGWEDRRRGWDRWDRHNAPRPAPLPTYQREYRGDRYPDHVRQEQLHADRYRYQPRDNVTQRAYEQRREQSHRDVREERRNPQDSFRSERGPGDLSTDHQGTTRLPRDHSGG